MTMTKGHAAGLVNAINHEARFKLVQARTELLFSQCFFGTLAMHLRLVEDPNCFIAYTDGEVLGYNPFAILALTPEECQWVVMHETLHCALGHPWRRGARQWQRWCYATDVVVNHTCGEVSLKQPANTVPMIPEFKGKCAEHVYAHLPPSPEIQVTLNLFSKSDDGNGSGNGNGSSQQGKSDSSDQNNQDQSGGGGKQQKQPQKQKKGSASAGTGKPMQGQHCGCDGVRDAGTGKDSNGSNAPSEADWQVKVTQAANAARAAGQLPSSLEYLVGKLEAPRIDWRAALRRFVQDYATADYSWRRPNRKYVASSLYLPALHNEQMPPIAVGVDTSGSISDAELTAFFSEIQSIVDEVKPTRTFVIQCDAAVKTPHDTFESDERFADRNIKVHGRGGTAFNPVFEYIEAQDLQPVCLLYLTDLECYDDPQPPDGYEVMWVSVNESLTGRFGETIYLNDGGVRQ